MKKTQKLRFVVDGVQFYQRFRDICDSRLYDAALELSKSKAEKGNKVMGLVTTIRNKNIQVEYA